jgi:hypothetical protein
MQYTRPGKRWGRQMVRRHMKQVMIFVSACAALASAGCAGTQVRTDHDPHAQFANYRTFSLRSGHVINAGVTDDRDILVRDHIDQALQQTLQAKGLMPARENPDLIATYTARARAVVFVEPNLSPAVAYPDTVYDRDGTLVIDLIDPRTNRLVWRSMAQVKAGNLRPKHIAEVVDKALAAYPGTPTTAPRS